MTVGCSNPYYRERVSDTFMYARAKMPGLWFIFRGDGRKAGDKIAEAWSEENAKMITDALNLNEKTLTDALVALNRAEGSPPTQLVVTEAGIDWVKQRMATEPEFRQLVLDMAEQDPAYRAVLVAHGISLE